MNINKYLERIEIKDTDLAPNLKNLKLLQKHHLLSIPFENLDIHLKNPINLNANDFYTKIIENKRGGFCYELNGLFYKLLNQIGFESQMLSARVHIEDRKFGEEYDHLAILTKLGGQEYLVDVGFGDFTAEPIKFVLDIEQEDANGTFLIRKFDDEYLEVVKKSENEWDSEYIFKNLKRNLQEFAGMCSYHQTSTNSHFTKGKVCSVMTEDGRKSLTDKKFITTLNGKKTEIDVNSEEEFNKILKKEFGIEL